MAPLVAWVVHGDAGSHSLISDALGAQIHTLYAQHPGWTIQLHHDNLVALAKKNPELGLMADYAATGLPPGFRAAGQRSAQR